MSKLFNLYKPLLVGVVAFSASSVFAEGSGGFDPLSFLGEAKETVEQIVILLGGLLMAAGVADIMFLGYRKLKACLMGVDEIDEDGYIIQDGLSFVDENDLNDYLHIRDEWDDEMEREFQESLERNEG